MGEKKANGKKSAVIILIIVLQAGIGVNAVILKRGQLKKRS